MLEMVSVGAVGPAVGALQQALVEAGAGIDADELAAERYGPSTEAAVRAYQAAHGLAADGIVGPRTRAALGGAGDARFTAPGWRLDTSRAAVAHVLRAAAGRIGTVEVPPGSNRGPEIDLWLVAAGLSPGDPWCAAFATSMYACSNGGNPFGRPLGSAWKVSDWGRERGALVAATERTIPGDLFVILRRGGHGHVGLVAADLGGGVLATIEGNAGNAVRGLLRDRSAFTEIVRPLPT